MSKSKNLILFMPSIDGGGVEKNLIIIANYLIKKFSKLTIITYDTKFSAKFNKKIKIISYKKNSNGTKKYFKYFVCLILLIQEFIKENKVLVVSFQANIYVLFLSIFFRYKTIVRSNSAPTGWSKSIIKKKIFKHFFSYAKEVIVNSHEFKKLVDKEFKTNCKVIYNPLNKKEILNLSKKRLLNFNFFKNKKKCINIINVARFTDQKDHLTLLRALNNVKKRINFKLLIIGYGVNKKIIIDFIKKNNLSKKMKVMNFQQNPYKYINKSDVFILTSIYEGLPNVLLEAMALKKIIISSDCPTGPKEILNNGKYGIIFKTKSVKDLEKKILNLKYYKTDKMKKLGYDSLKRFDYEKCNLQYYNLLSKYLQSSIQASK